MNCQQIKNIIENDIFIYNKTIIKWLNILLLVNNKLFITLLYILLNKIKIKIKILEDVKKNIIYYKYQIIKKILN